MVVFGWSKGNIAFIAMWGGIISAFLCIPFAGVMDKYGEIQGHIVYIYNRPGQIRNMNQNHIQIFKPSESKQYYLFSCGGLLSR